MNLAVIIRSEMPSDHSQVDQINQLAFGGDGEMKLVQRLRSSDDLVLSAVAEQSGIVIGHVLFTRGFIHAKSTLIPSVALGPMSVYPSHQREGVGSRLVAESLEMISSLGERHCFVLGHTWFYPKFGFLPASQFQIESIYNAGAHFMGVEIIPGSLKGISGRFVYPGAFADL